MSKIKVLELSSEGQSVFVTTQQSWMNWQIQNKKILSLSYETERLLSSFFQSEPQNTVLLKSRFLNGS